MLRNTIMAASDTVLLFDAGAGTAQGGRMSQEDRYLLLFPDQFPSKSTNKVALFAVLDGHGSAMVSEHVRTHLPKLLASRPEFDKGDFETAIKRAFEDEDKLLLQMVMDDDDPEPVISGTTVALCLADLTRGLLVSGNVGDSHIVFVEREPGTEAILRLELLTQAHKPNAPSEKRRIEQAGGAVHVYGGSARLGTLNMSRALGDLQYKNPINTLDVNSSSRGRRANAAAPNLRGNFLSNEPYVRTIMLDPQSRYAILCVSDGITDQTDERTLMEYVMKQLHRGRRATDIAREISVLPASNLESDNCTSVVAFFDGINA